MECYNIEWRPSTKKDLKKISKAEVPKIIKAVESLSDQPRPLGSTKLSGSDLTYRIRVGDIVSSMKYTMRLFWLKSSR
jgi:mRNA interferase RelE/StbE